MSKATKAEVELRIDELYELVVARASYRAIVGHCERKWNIGERQVDAYIGRVKERIVALATPTQEEQLAKAIAAYETLFTKQLAAGRLNDARKTMDSIVHLLGLAAPEKHEIEGGIAVKGYVNLDEEEL